MKRINIIIRIRLIALCFLIVLLVQCEKTNDIEMATQVTVDTIEPTAGKAGTLVTVKGKGYSLILPEDTVKFNGVPGEIEKVTDTTILVYAPAEGSTGPVTVMVRNKQVEGAVFTYLGGDDPYIISISPTVGWDYSTTAVKIRGGNFGAEENKAEVTFDNITASVQFFSDTLLIVSPPQHEAGKVPVLVKTNEKVSNIVYYSYQQKPEIKSVYRNTQDPLSPYYLGVTNLDRENSVIKALVNGNHEVKIDSIYRKGTHEYTLEPVGDKIALMEDEVDQYLSSFYADFVVSSNGIKSDPGHIENSPIIANITSEGKETYHFGAGDIVTITGKYFGPDTQHSKLELWQTTIPVMQLMPNPEVLSWSNIKIEIVIPDYPFHYDQQVKTIPLKLWIRTNGESAHVSNADVIYEVATQETGAYMVSTLAGSVQGYKDGVGPEAEFNGLSYLDVDSEGNIYVGDRFNNRIRKITPDGVVTTFAGSGISGYKDGSALQAQFILPLGITVDKSDNVFVSEYQGNIRKITQEGIVSTFSSGYYQGGIEDDDQGNLYVLKGDYVVYKITPANTLSVIAGIHNQQGYLDTIAALAQFSDLSDLTIDAQGDLYIADEGNYNIRKITFNHNPTYQYPPKVTTVAGSRNSINGYADGTASDALFNVVSGLVSDKDGNIYIADAHRIRKLDITMGVVSTIAGGEAGFADGPGSKAQFNRIFGIAIDLQRNVLYVADDGNNRIRKISLNPH